jgi:hypothetical protein
MKFDGQTESRITVLRPSAGDIGGWVDKIKTLWGRGTRSTLELAKAVCVARCKLRHGAWTQLWKTGGVRLSKRKGDMLAAIGKQLAELDERTSAHFPAEWNTLYQVALLDLPDIQQPTKAGIIHLELKLREAKQLLAEFRGQPARNQSPQLNFRQRLKKFDQFIRTTSKDCSVAERKLVTLQLRNLSEEVAALDHPSGVFNFQINSFRISPRSHMVSAAHNSV